MNYKLHYDRLINRAINRVLDAYTETHHIVPRCLGGTDSINNLVELTPEEHYTAHLLLVRMYPDNRKLVHSAVMMTVSSKNLRRSKNKMYGWLRRKHSESISVSQAGNKNSQYGKCWVFDPGSNISKSIKREELDNYTSLGWITGRNLKKKVCECCGKEFFSKKVSTKTCSKECKYVVLSTNAYSRGNGRAVLDDKNNKFRSMSSAARYYNIDIETVRYRVKIGRYRWVD